MTTSVIIPALLLSLLASLFLLARGVVRVCFGAEKHWWLELSFAVLSIGAASFIAIDMIQESRALLATHLELYADLGCLLFCIVMTYFSIRTCTLHGSASSLRRNSHSWLLILIAFFMASWSYHRVMVRSLGCDFLGIAEAIPGVLERDRQYDATTDVGNDIPLYRLETGDHEFDEYASSAEVKLSSFHHLGIRRQDADKMANCHGWVFTEGRFLLKGMDVDRILCDNHYFIVKDPKPGDIVIYRNEDGGILHTALVQGILRDGNVIAESKWGIDQRFLHLPANQPYSQFYEYYRTNRPNHLINVRESTIYDD